MKAPPRAPVSSAYSYSPMMEYSHEEPHFVRPPKSSRVTHYSTRPSKSQHDYVSHASEIVPIVAESSLRYGERILPTGAAAHAPAQAPVSAQPLRPIHRHRTQRTRVVVRPKMQSSVEYYQPAETTPAPPPAPIVEDYSYPASAYEPEVNHPQVESIAMEPVKSEFTELAEPVASQQVKPSSDRGLPENLLNYIRQMQGQVIPEKSQSDLNQEAQLSGQSKSALPASESHESDKEPPKPEIQSDGGALVSPTPYKEPESIPLLTQLPIQQSSIKIDHQNTIPSSFPTIHSQWQQSFSSVHSPSAPTQYQASDYVYRPPELKVMRNLPRYKEPLPQLLPQTPSLVSPLRHSFVNPSNSKKTSQSVAKDPSTAPQHSQFVYSVSHAHSQPNFSFSAPGSFPSVYQSSYPSSDNFGLTNFQRQSQLKSHQTSQPATYLPSGLNAAASMESSQWIKPSEKAGAKSKFLNTFGHRLSHFF